MTHCNTQLTLSHLTKTPVVVDFNGGNLTHDSGVFFLRQVDDRIRLTERLGGCLA